MQKRPIEPERIDQMISGIVRRLESMGETDIGSKQIGEIVMEALARIDTVAYVRFASVYKNFQAADDFDKFVQELRPDTHRQRDCERHALYGACAVLGAARAGQHMAQPCGGLCDCVRWAIVGRGWTAPSGRPMRRPQALAQAGARARCRRLCHAGTLCASRSNAALCAGVD